MSSIASARPVPQEELRRTVNSVQTIILGCRRSRDLVEAGSLFLRSVRAGLGGLLALGVGWGGWGGAGTIRRRKFKGCQNG